MAINDSYEEVFTKAFWYEMNEVYTSMPCVVVEVVDDLKEQRVHVQPCLNKLLLNGKATPRSVILNIPVIFPSTGTSAITMPINKGDLVWCNFSMRAMEVFNESEGKTSTPNNYAKFDQKDAVAFIGMTTRRTAINNPAKRKLSHSTLDLVVAHNIGKSAEVEIRFKPNGDLVVTSPTKMKFESPEMELNATSQMTIDTPSLTVNADTTTWTGNTNHTGNTTQSGSITATSVTASTIVGGGKDLGTHTHGGVMSGGSDTSPPN
jgi:hypothetical protein